MGKIYKIIEAHSPYDSHVFEELEVKVNEAAKDGYRLLEKSIWVFREDRGPSEMELCRAIAVMSKKDDEKKRKKNLLAKEVADILP